MKCPVCPEATLAMSSRQGIEIDYCPQCRGVWLDRGEIDKIIERSLAEAAPTQRNEGHSRPAPRYGDDEGRRYDGDRDSYKHKRRRGLLGDLFDFD